MSEFRTSVDIANRTLQHCGARRITALTDDSVNASEIAACYDQIRTAELRRNVWRFGIRKAALRPIDTTTMLLVPKAWSGSNLYMVGSIVAYANAIYYATTNFNLNTLPNLPFNGWTRYFGPMTVSLWAATEGYYSGELVYTPGTSAYKVYLALETNSQTSSPPLPAPGAIPAWGATITYNTGQTATYSATTWQSNIDLNLNTAPAANAAWAIGTTYAANALVLGTDNHNYSSVAGSNVGHNPVGDAGVHWTDLGPAPWIVIPANQVGILTGSAWLQLDASIQSLQFVYPLGSGPSNQSATRNVFMLPNGFLREAPQDPKAGSVSYLGAPSGIGYNDWQLEGDFIVTREVQPILFRFAADVDDVSIMDPMFCEGLAARIALEVCERLTQSTAKLSDIGSAYGRFMSEARTVNGIETGASEPAEDDFITCRY